MISRRKRVLIVGAAKLTNELSIFFKTFFFCGFSIPVLLKQQKKENVMRKVVAGLFVSVDGVAEAPNEWQETFDEDMGAELSTVLPEIDTILLGRVTYQEWQGYWPNYEGDGPDSFYANMINTSPKYVVSTTLEEVSWGKFDNATLIKNNFVKEIKKLKKQAGKTIGVQGSPTLVNSLLQHDLLDELALYIHNVAVYKGKRLFSEGNLKRLNLVEAKPTRSGVIIAKYQPRPS
jgi:dihydrofolate reductase